MRRQIKKININHVLYKVELSVLKVFPMLIAFIYFINSILSYMNIETTFLSYIGGMSLIPLLFIYISSFVFNFCSYHRMFLYYVFIIDSLNIIDYYIGIPLSDLAILTLHMIITCIVLFIILFLHQIYKK